MCSIFDGTRCVLLFQTMLLLGLSSLFVSTCYRLLFLDLPFCVPGPEGSEVVVLRRGAVTEAQIGETLAKHGMGQTR